MRKQPKLKKTTINEQDYSIGRAGDNRPKIVTKEFISYKLSPQDKMALAVGYFALFSIIGGCAYYCL